METSAAATAAKEEAIERTTRLVDAVRNGDEQAFGGLYDQWHDGVFDMAYRITRDPEAAAEIAQETFLAAWRNLESLEEPRAFGAWLLRIARNKSFNWLDKERRSRPVDDEGMTVIEATSTTAAGPAGFSVEDRTSDVSEPEQIARDHELVDLVWESAEALGERDANVLDLHLRRGFAPAQIAETIGVTPNNANQMLHRVRNRLGDSVRARVVWRGGEPQCRELRGQLEAAQISTFDKTAVGAIVEHAKDCNECQQRQKTRLAPAALFAATPIILAPLALKQQTAAALEAEGVPMGGSELVGGGGGDVDFGDDDFEDDDFDGFDGFGSGARSSVDAHDVEPGVDFDDEGIDFGFGESEVESESESEFETSAPFEASVEFESIDEEPDVEVPDDTADDASDAI